MNRLIQVGTITGILIVLIAYLPSRFAANVGNIYLVRGMLNSESEVNLETWTHARSWLKWASQRLNVAHAKRLQKCITRIDAFVERYAQDNPFSQNPPVQPYSPEYPVNASIEDHLLLGYDLDERAVELQDQVHMWLYWQSGDGSVIVRPFQADNLVANGGFEQAVNVDGDVPWGFARDRRDRWRKILPPFPYRRVAVYTRDDHPTLCAELDNRSIETYSGYLSENFPAQRDTYYLVSAWVGGDTKGVGVGLLYLGDEGYSLPTVARPDAYVPARLSEGQWTYYAGVLLPPHETTVLNAQLVYQGTDIVCLDNMFVVPLAPP